MKIFSHCTSNGWEGKFAYHLALSSHQGLKFKYFPGKRKKNNFIPPLLEVFWRVPQSNIYPLLLPIAPSSLLGYKISKESSPQDGKTSEDGKTLWLKENARDNCKNCSKKNAKLVSEMESSAKYKKNIITCKSLSNQHIVALKRKTMNRTIKDLDVN